MIISGFIFWTIIAAIGITLIVTAKDDTLASISGMVFAILGSVWAGFSYAMLMGW